MRVNHNFIAKSLLFVVIFSALAKFFVYVGALAALYFSIRLVRAMEWLPALALARLWEPDSLTIYHLKPGSCVW